MFDPREVADKCISRFVDEFKGVENSVRGRLFVIIESEVRRAYASELETSAAPPEQPMEYPR